MNVAVVSHCDFSGNSAFHALAVARELHARGYSPVILLPANKETVEYVGEPPFPVLTYEEAQAGPLPFSDGKGPDLVHAFTPREHVRLVTEALVRTHGCPYVVHLEDNEEVILADDLTLYARNGSGPVPLAALDTIPGMTLRSHPLRARRFLDGAAGLTAVIDGLLEFKPDHVPGAVFWPGFEAAMLEDRPRGPLRDELGLAAEDLAVVYTGNIHNSNLRDVRSLYIAVGLLRRAGLPVRLVKTGWNHVDMAWADEVVDAEGVLELGFVGRDRVADLLAVADVLVQPGGANPFNDYRFPSKLPEFLASGKPVVLAETNLGHHLVDGKEALLLRHGDATEIFHAVRRLAEDPALRARLGANGRRFAVERLSWDRNVDAIVDLYERIAKGGGPAVPRAREPVEPDPWIAPAVKLVAFHFGGDADTLAGDAELARAHGIYGFCFRWHDGSAQPADRVLESDEWDLPFCLCWANESRARAWPAYETRDPAANYAPGWDERFIHAVLPALDDPRAIRVDGAPLLLVHRAAQVPDLARAVDRWRGIALRERGLELHLAAVESVGVEDPRPFGLDAAVEFPPHTKALLVAGEDAAEPGFQGYVEDARLAMAHQLTRPLPDYRWYRGAMPGWDARARRGPDAHVVLDSSPEAFRTWFRKLVLQTACRSSVDEPLVFLNAWSEWAERVDDGHPWLEATRAALVDGLRQYYASLGFELGEEQVADYVRDVLGAPSYAAAASAIAPSTPEREPSAGGTRNAVGSPTSR